ncbi:TIGR02253 family HAD-type hydrolase [Candidatus Micrarchaeota archaeon]|nr:TIGR02253 family HAD-type hydrolase [Candidatus Micrarchaeota archaeon]
MIKNIFFDIDDTLFPTTDFSSLARKNAINAMIGMGLDATYSDLEHSLSKIIQKKGSNYTHHFDDLCKSLKIKKSAKFVSAAIAAYHDTKTTIAPYPQVPSTLLNLRQKGYNLYVATNGTSIKQWDKLIRLSIALFFDDVFVSEDVGRSKDELFFTRILSNLRAKPTESLMIGDREDADIIPAKKAGMKTIRILSGKYANSRSSKADATISDFGMLLATLDRWRRL